MSVTSAELKKFTFPFVSVTIGYSLSFILQQNEYNDRERNTSFKVHIASKIYILILLKNVYKHFAVVKNSAEAIRFYHTNDRYQVQMCVAHSYSKTMYRLNT